MQTIAERKSVPFLGEHPTISRRILLTSNGDFDETLLAGTVIGTSPSGESNQTVTTTIYDDTKATVVGILAEDVTVPANGDAWAVVYVHCCAVASGLIWGEALSATDQGAAIEEMRGIGIFVEG